LDVLRTNKALRWFCMFQKQISRLARDVNMLSMSMHGK
jgi:hypothetical protein